MTYMGYMLSLMLKRNIEVRNTFDHNSIGILDDQIKEMAMSQDIRCLIETRTATHHTHVNISVLNVN